MFDSNQFFGGGAGDFYPVSIDQSLRFNSADNAYLSQTVSGTADSTTATTASFWVKRTAFATNHQIFSCYESNVAGYFQFDGDDQFAVYIDQSAAGSDETRWETTAVFRDPSAWYHFVVKIDVSQATNADKVKIYVNGVLQATTASQTGSAITAQRLLKNGASLKIGEYFNGASNVDGYLAEVHFTDGTAYDADAFGELKSGVWVAKTPSVTYGTNGFYLDFANSADIGNDISGNGNDWTPNNFSAYDVVPDSPTNNFCTWNSLEERNQQDIVPVDDRSGTLSEGNLRWNSPTCSTRNHSATSTFWVDSGKWYWEGVMTRDAGGQSRFAMGTKYFPSRFDWFYASTASVGTVYGIKVDLEANSLQFTTDGTTYSNFTADGSNSSSLGDYPLTAMFVGCDSAAVANFGQDSTFAGAKTAGGNTDSNGIGDFYYTPPSGYLALSTANLPEPTFSPADDASPEDYFNTVLYAGDGVAIASGGNAVTGIGFQPDWVWIKSRVNAFHSHQLYDAVRGATKRLFSDDTSAELTAPEGLASFDSDGFTVGDRVQTNTSGDSYVSWNWKANGSGVSNTDGDFAVTVSANTTSGFSIVDLTDPNTGASYEVGHGLDSAPEMFFIKKTNTTSDWSVYHKDVGNDRRLVLNDTAGQSGSSSVYFGSTTPTSSVVTIGSGLSTGDDWIAYCFHSVEGFSKFGSYTGNGSTDGTFVYTGFRPSFVILKRTDSGGSWTISDSVRDTSNPITPYLFPAASDAEATDTSNEVDFVSNGFKIRHNSRNNTSGATYIYMCFSANPFKYSTAY